MCIIRPYLSTQEGAALIALRAYIDREDCRELAIYLARRGERRSHVALQLLAAFHLADQSLLQVDGLTGHSVVAQDACGIAFGIVLVDHPVIVVAIHPRQA